MTHQPQPFCAWCNKMPAGKLLENGLVSHSICAACADAVKRELELSKLNAMWHATSDQEDDLGPAYGIISGLLVSGSLWGILAVLWRMI